MTNAHKLAALRAHSLDEQDRKWLLSSLSETERKTLMPLLHELESLGFPKHSVGVVGDTASMPGVTRKHSPGVAAIDACPARLVARVLEREQPATIAVVIGYYPWSWRSSVLRRLGRALRLAITDQIQSGRPAPRAQVRECIVASFADALRSEGSLPARGWLGKWS